VVLLLILLMVVEDVRVVELLPELLEAEADH
jgi:hypothetical protein